MTPLSIAFLPLTDSAVLIAARERGFAAEQSIDLQLVRSTSWATSRDRLVYGQVQAAHMLAPLAVAVTLGLSQSPVRLAAPFKLNLNGNALVMAPAFTAALEPDIAARVADPLATAHDFAAAIGLYHRKPVIGVVHRFSSHALSLRYWLAVAGVDPDRDVSLRVLPPSLMVEAMRAREIDGFIAGAPWPTVALESGVAEPVALGARIWQRGVEKVLAFRADWLEGNAGVVDRLLAALSAAAAWCDEPDHRESLAALLAEPRYLDLPADLILPGLAGEVGQGADAQDRMVFHRDAAAFPWRSQAEWIYAQLVRWSMAEATEDNRLRAAEVFRSDIYRHALGSAGLPMPGASSKLEGALAGPTPVGAHGGALTLGPDRFFDGRIFDPDRLDDYLAQDRAG